MCSLWGMVRLDSPRCRLVNGGSDRWPGRRLHGLTGPYVAGAGGFSWQSVLSLVPGTWEAPSIRDFPAGGERREPPITLARSTLQ